MSGPLHMTRIRDFLPCVEEKILCTMGKSRMSKYVNLLTVKTKYAMRMNRLSNRIFGEVVRETPEPSMKVVKLFSEKPVNKRPEIVEYYPRLRETHLLMKNLRWYGLYRDEHQDFKEEYKRLRILRGKQPWVKGEKKKKKDE